jgi:hypothetical protein
VVRTREEFRRRTEILGVDPELVLVLETNRQLDPEVVERAGLQVLELTSDTALVAFATDPEMTEFLRRNSEYEKGSPGLTSAGNERAAAYQDLFDAVDNLRALLPSDVLTDQLLRSLGRVDGDRTLRVEIQCWCPEEETEARRRHDEVKAAITLAGGIVLDASLRTRAGLSVIICEINATAILALASVDRVRRIDFLPKPLITVPQLRSTTPEDLPAVTAPSVDAPIVGVIDSGMRFAHPLITPALLGAEYLDARLGDAGDESGHGTFVASLALYGSLEEALANRTPLVPAGRLVSVRVLDHDDNFPDDKVWETQLLEAMHVAVSAGARVINLSIGDSRHPYRPPRQTPLAALIDEFVRAHDVVVVISAGNYPPSAYDVEALSSRRYPSDLLNASDSGILDPGSSALALTVGALCSDLHQGADGFPRGQADTVPVGSAGAMSPLTRAGPGAMYMIKPDLVAPGGSVAIDTLMGRVITTDRRAQVVGAGGNVPEHLLASDAGTSYAAPLVSHAALRVLARYPLLSANAVRALLLLSAESVEDVVAGETNADGQRHQRRLSGYGRVSAERAEASDDFRAILLAEEQINVDDVHLYVVPLPTAFVTGLVRRSLSIALAYDPPVRATRLDYLASRMSVWAFYGATVKQVASAFAEDPGLSATHTSDDNPPMAIRRYRLDLQPADSARGRGAHHVGRFSRQRPFQGTNGRAVVIAVRNSKQWESIDPVQRYALAVALQQQPYSGAALYAELRAHFEALIEVEIEAEM